MLVGLAAGLVLAPFILPHLVRHPDRLSQAIGAQLQPGPVADFYRARGYRALWIAGRTFDPAVSRLISAVRAARTDDLDPGAYHPDELTADLALGARDPRQAAVTELALSEAFTRYIADLHRPVADARMAWVDPGAPAAATDPAVILDQAARAPSMSLALVAARRMNPIYQALRAVLARPGLGGPEARLVRANLERARALPPDPGRRYLVVNIPSQTLEAFDHGHRVLAMRVVVGARDNKTPAMIGLIRYALFNPYWQVPPDLVRQDIAPAALRDPTYLMRQHYETVGSEAVDWEAVAYGAMTVEVRQTPGPDNVMGKVKFMLPNPLGIYLHDTPDKFLFADTRRTDSHGCVRLQHALVLADWLLGRRIRPDRAGPPDQRTDLDPPVPVYITYLTAMPRGRGVTFAPDIYGRDPTLTAELAGAGRA